MWSSPRLLKSLGQTERKRGLQGLTRGDQSAQNEKKEEEKETELCVLQGVSVPRKLL